MVVSQIDTEHFVVGMRVRVYPQQRTGWRACIWRWLTRQNLRVAAIDTRDRSLTLERCR